ncbi:MAG TPA: hypothetical protein VGK96_12465 [Candidatus Sulfotelmatobacter sp.]
MTLTVLQQVETPCQLREEPDPDIGNFYGAYATVCPHPDAPPQPPQSSRNP